MSRKRKKHPMEYLGKHRGKCPYCDHRIEFDEATRIFGRRHYGRLRCPNCGQRVMLEELKNVVLALPANEYFSSEEEPQ